MIAERKSSFARIRMEYIPPSREEGSTFGPRYDLSLGQPYAGGGLGGPSFRVFVVKRGDRDRANKVTGANAGGSPQLPIRTRGAARVAQFSR